MNALQLALLDADSRRRAEATFALSQQNFIIAPFEDMSELVPSAKKSAAFLVFDFPGVIANLLNWMGDNNVWRPIIAYAQAPSIARVVSAISEGANDYMSWPISPSKVQYSIEQLAGLTNSLGEQKARRWQARRRIDELSCRERQTLVLVARGFSNRHIGERLSISPRTVEIFRANGIRKLGVESTVEATQIVYEAGLVHDVANESWE